MFIRIDIYYGRVRITNTSYIEVKHDKLIY